MFSLFFVKIDMGLKKVKFISDPTLFVNFGQFLKWPVKFLKCLKPKKNSHLSSNN